MLDHVSWRGLQESSYVEGAPRPENVVINKVITQARDYIDNGHINQVAVQLDEWLAKRDP